MYFGVCQQRSMQEGRSAYLITDAFHNLVIHYTRVNSNVQVIQMGNNDGITCLVGRPE